MMRNILTYGIFTVSLLGAPSLALANSGLSYTPPGGSVQMAETEQGEDALNYFASGQHKKEEMAVQEELRESGEGIPASQLEALPETVSIEGKTELKIQGGQIVTGTTNASYTPCNSDSPSTDECIQTRGGAEPVITRTRTTYDTPTTLDQQLMDKQASGESVPEPQMPKAGDSVINNQRVETAIDQNVENTSVVDKERGAKTNIISNTDTGVKLAE